MNVLELDDLDAAQVERVLALASAWKLPGAEIPPVLADQAWALVFEKPSARTRVATERAVQTLGGTALILRGDEVGIGARESAADVARTLRSYCAGIAARVYDHANLEAMARSVEIPVLNLLSDRAHPCQALADVMTMRETFGTVEGRRLAFIGDGNNVAASLAFAAALTGFELVLSSPAGYELDENTAARARKLGAVIERVPDPADAVRDADAVYTDTWVSMGQEGEADVRRPAFLSYQVNAELLAGARPEAIFLHCLPAHRGDEVTDDVLDGPRSRIWQQTENRMHVARGLLAVMTEGN